ncbi:MAG: HNH endonuclease [Bacteroidetes bacterium]|nr:HNH endonuclease [Bacteroidota bacterium]
MNLINIYNSDSLIRIAAFEWLKKQMQINGDVLDYELLRNGFEYRGEKIHLVGQTGIWKPRQCKYPISILTSIRSKYEDAMRDDDYIVYSYRGTDPNHHDNVGLRNVMQKQLPLIYLLGVSRGRYIPIFPSFIHHDDPKNLRILLQVDTRMAQSKIELNDIIKDPVRDYMTVEVKRRTHQGIFRENILHAYKCQCAFCKIRHTPLLDAAHIIADNELKGEPVIPNGLALCKIHHAAFDANLMGVTPDFIIKVKEDLLYEIDGPMLQHGIKELNNNKIILPSKNEWKPDKSRLELRYQAFLKTG